MKYLSILLLIFVSCSDVLEEIEVIDEKSYHLPESDTVLTWIGIKESYKFEKYNGWLFVYSDSVNVEWVESVKSHIDTLTSLTGIYEELKERSIILFGDVNGTMAAEVEKRKLKVGISFHGMVKIYCNPTLDIFVHELGHVKDFSNYQLDVKSEINRLFQMSQLGGYSSKNVREFYAEIFRMYLLDSNSLKQQFNDAYLFLSNTI